MVTAIFSRTNSTSAVNFFDGLKPLRPIFIDRNKLLFNLFMGLMLCLVLVWLRSYPLIGEAEDAGMDLIMKISKEKIPASTKDKDKIPSFVFLDIDNETIKLWEKEKEKTLLLTPRDRLKNLIKTAVDANAKLVVVDINLTLTTPVEKGQPLSDDHDCQKLKLHQDDCDLYKYLRDDYPKKCKEDNSRCSPVILTRSLENASEVESSFWQKITHKMPIPTKEFTSSSFLDQVVENQKFYMQWTSITFPSSSDQIIRQWQLWNPVCVGKRVEFVHSVQLLVASVVYQGNLQKAQDQLSPEMARFNQTIDCGESNYIPPQEQEQIKIAENVAVSAGSGGISQRIVYNMLWLTEKDRRSKAIEGNRYCLPVDHSLGNFPKYCLTDTNDNEILKVFSALDFAKVPLEINTEILADKIVVVGGSWTSGNVSDMHLTPIGEMPGALIVVNAIHSLLRYPEIGTFLWYIEIIGLLLFTLSIIIVFTKTHDSHLTASILGFFIIPIVVFISWSCFWYLNIWLSFVTPLLIIYYGHIMVEGNNPASKNASHQVS
ncbi:MAG: hypothetical protein BWK78_02805 [Thiotrichaceae bacterium IS1]|nr:MAG: hypothetical protein BWK78_02805 [Thiotrichaceae bacterium IS1]